MAVIGRISEEVLKMISTYELPQNEECPEDIGGEYQGNTPRVTNVGVKHSSKELIKKSDS